MKDLGTLGGPDSAPGAVMNEHGQVTGSSYINFTPNPDTGAPTADPFLWADGKMIDLGSFGGTDGFGLAVNDRGQVVGQSNLAGDVIKHAFLWERGTLNDLGTLGGTFSVPDWLSEAGDVVGGATTLEDQLFHAFLWRNGVMKDLGTLADNCFSEALAINSAGQAVGYSLSCDGSVFRASLWERDGIFDLQTLIPPNADLQLQFGFNINDRGEIVGVGVPPGVPPNADFFGHLFVLIPCDGEDGEGCVAPSQGTTRTTQNSAAPATSNSTAAIKGQVRPGEIVAAWRARLAHRHHIPGLRALKY